MSNDQLTAKIPTWVSGNLVAFDKLEAHRRGLLHKAVSVFVLCGEDVLIQRRAMCKYHTPGLWANTCCTHPHWGEQPEACAHRRLAEELGLTGLDLQHRNTVKYKADVGDGMVEHELVDIFTSHVDVRPTVTPNSDEVMETSWLSVADLTQRVQDTPEQYTPWLGIYLREHADQIFS